MTRSTTTTTARCPVLAANDGDEQAVSGEAEAEPKASEAADPNDDNDPIKINNDLRKKYGQQAVNYIARLHRSLGHPSAETMLRMLEEVQATDAVKAARLCADSAWIETTSGRNAPGLNSLDAQSTSECVDEAKAWSSQALRDFCSNNGITLEVAPAEAHSWLDATERKHQVVRRAIEVFLEQKGTNSFDNLKEALIYIPAQANNMSFVNG